MTIQDLLTAVKQENLDKWALEKYHDEATHLFADMQMSMGDLERQEALFFQKPEFAEDTDIAIKRKWKASVQGQRMIEVKNGLRALSKELSGLRHKLFNTL